MSNSRQGKGRLARMYPASSSAHGVDCVTFFSLSAPHRWREIEDFFPQDDDLEYHFEQAVKALPKMNKTLANVCCGSCKHRVTDEDEEEYARVLDRRMKRRDVMWCESEAWRVTACMILFTLGLNRDRVIALTRTWLPHNCVVL